VLRTFLSRSALLRYSIYSCHNFNVSHLFFLILSSYFSFYLIFSFSFSSCSPFPLHFLFLFLFTFSLSFSFQGTYCPLGTPNPVLCPLGYRGSIAGNSTHSVQQSLSAGEKKMIIFNFIKFLFFKLFSHLFIKQSDR
jgi:hypothetical protein